MGGITRQWQIQPGWAALAFAGTLTLIIGARAAWMDHPETTAQPPSGSLSAPHELALAASTSRWSESGTTPRRERVAFNASTELDPESAARGLLPSSFRTLETRRFVVLSDADSRWVRMQAERLERAAHQFERVMRRIGIEPGSLRHNLVCILFDNHEQYLHFASAYDNVQARWVTGYYATRSDRIVFYNMESSPQIDNARRSVRAMQEQVGNLRNELDLAHRQGDRERAAALRHELVQQKEHVRNESRRIEKFTEDVVVATIIHEAIHQLAFHTGVQRPDVQYPIWISEGLATAFETEAPNRAFGPDHEFEPRRERFIEHLADEKLLPLRELVQITSLRDADAQTVSAAYHQSYALVTWMMRSRRNELRSYLELMQQAPSGDADPATHLKRFEQAFGQVDQVERIWLRHERSALR